MTTRNLAALAPPLFMSKNFVNRGSEKASNLNSTQDAVDSTTIELLRRIFDMTRTSFWVSFGSNDTKQDIITVGLYEGSGKIQRSIDFIAIMNHNLRRFKIEYRVGAGSFTLVPGSNFISTDFTGGSNIILSLSSSIVADELRIVMDATQGSSTDKQVGEFIAALSSLQTSKGWREFNIDFEDNIKTLRNADGSIDDAKIFRSPTSAEFWRADVSFRGILEAQRDLLFAEKVKRPPLLVYPEPGERPGDIFLVRFKPSSWREKYTSMNRAQGLYDVSFGLEEVGGA